MSDESPASAEEPEIAAAQQGAKFRPTAVLLIVVPITALLLGGVVFFGFFEGAQWLSDAAKPARVNVVGSVIYNGAPLADAVIETRPVDGNLAGAIGSGDAEGEFKLLTQIRGDFLDGAYAGEHMVTVKGYDMTVMTLGTPPLLTPSKYASFESSPLRISVKEGVSPVVLTLEGEPDPRPARNPPGNGPPRRGGDAGSQEGDAPPDPEPSEGETEAGTEAGTEASEGETEAGTEERQVETPPETETGPGE